jgi:uncharacterized protein (UPF0264 family)
MSGLLVSVRSATEAQAALEGGATLIDVKEPARGAMGRADEGVLAAVLASVAGRAPVSAAMGELLVHQPVAPRRELAFAKWGMHGANLHNWRQAFLRLRDFHACAVVPCAYAEETDVHTPLVEEVAAFAAEHRFPVLLVDTFHKDGRTLLDHLRLEQLARIAERCRDGGVKLALAGSLNADAIETLLPLRPAWFAVRGAACAGGRNGTVQTARVKMLAELMTKMEVC